MEIGKSLILGAVVIGLLSGGTATAAAWGEQAGAPTRSDVQRELRKEMGGNGHPIKSVKCHRSDDESADPGVDSWWNCRIDYRFSADTKASVLWSAGANGRISVIDTPGSRGYAGQWYKKCRQTRGKSYCERLGRKQMKLCRFGTEAGRTEAQERKQCLKEIFGNASRD